MQHSRNTTPPIVSQAVTLDLVHPTGTRTPVAAELQYDARHPYAVTTVFMTGGSQVRWTFGRDLLRVGLHEPTGVGDVHVWPGLDSDGNAVVMIELHSPDGDAHVQARTADLSAFVERMTSAVVPGTESERIDVDAAISAILEPEGA
jgi:hypothetical protein